LATRASSRNPLTPNGPDGNPNARIVRFATPPTDGSFVLQCALRPSPLGLGRDAGTRRACCAIVDELLRRVAVIVAHYRRFRLPVDAREVARRALAAQSGEKNLACRAVLEEAVASLVCGFR